MKWTIAFISMGMIWSLGCRKDAPDQPPVVPMPAPSAPENIPVEDKPTALDKTKTSEAVEETRDRVAPVVLPTAPAEPLALVASKAGARCRINDADCASLIPLAAAIEKDVSAAKSLLKNGTDQQKSVLLQSLLKTKAAVADALMIEQLVGSNGQLNLSMLDALATRRSIGATQTLVGLLNKSIGADVIAIVDALSRIGTDEAVKALRAGLKSTRLRPHWGTLCRAVSRTLDVSAIPDLAKLGAALNATERQAEGCRGAEVALRMYQSSTRLAVNVGAEQQRKPQVAVSQRVDEPGALRIRVVADTEKPCEAEGSVLELQAALDRTGEAVVGHGLVPAPVLGSTIGSRDSVYLFRFGTLTLKRGTPVDGSMHVDIRTKDSPRVIASGAFTGVYCGVR